MEPLEDEDDGTPDPKRRQSEALAVFRQLADVADAEIEEPDGVIRLARLRDRGARRLRHASRSRSCSSCGRSGSRLQRLTELLEQALAAMTREREIRERAATNGRVSQLGP